MASGWELGVKYRDVDMHTWADLCWGCWGCCCCYIICTFTLSLRLACSRPRLSTKIREAVVDRKRTESFDVFRILTNPFVIRFFSTFSNCSQYIGILFSGCPSEHNFCFAQILYSSNICDAWLSTPWRTTEAEHEADAYHSQFHYWFLSEIHNIRSRIEADGSDATDTTEFTMLRIFFVWHASHSARQRQANQERGRGFSCSADALCLVVSFVIRWCVCCWEIAIGK